MDSKEVSEETCSQTVDGTAYLRNIKDASCKISLLDRTPG